MTNYDLTDLKSTLIKDLIKYFNKGSKKCLNQGYKKYLNKGSKKVP